MYIVTSAGGGGGRNLDERKKLERLTTLPKIIAMAPRRFYRPPLHS